MSERGGLFVQRLSLNHPDLEGAWRQLQAGGGVPSPFLTWQWCTGLLNEPDTAAGTTVRVVKRYGKVIGLFPVEQTTVAGMRTLGPAGWRWLAPDHLDVVSLPEDRTVVAAATAADILHDTVDMVDMDGLAPHGALVNAFKRSRRQFVRKRIVFWRVEHTVTPYLALKQEPLLRSASLRSQVARGRRAVERAGGGFEIVTEPEAVVRLLDDLMHLHIERFGQESEVFATEARRRAHRVAARRLASDGLARIYRLYTPTENVALLYALKRDGTLSYYQAGMQAGVTLSPGRTLLGLVAMASKEEGLYELDLLRGEHEYKARFATSNRHDVRIRLVRATPAAGMAAARRVASLLAAPPSARQLH